MLACQKNPDALILGNHETSTSIQEISIIVENFLADSDPNTMAGCKGRSDWNKYEEAIEAKLNSLRKRKVFIDVIHTPPRIFPVGFK
jgi:glutathionylspermidine synthase